MNHRVFHRRQQGQSLVEYALILALVSVAVIFILRNLGGSVNEGLDSVNGVFATGGGSGSSSGGGGGVGGGSGGR